MEVTEYFKNIKTNIEEKDTIIKKFEKEIDVQRSNSNNENGGIFFLILISILGLCTLAVGTKVSILVKLLYVLPTIMCIFLFILVRKEKGNTYTQVIFEKSFIACSVNAICFQGVYLFNFVLNSKLDNLYYIKNYGILVVYVIVVTIASFRYVPKNIMKKYSNKKLNTKSMGLLWNSIITLAAIVGATSQAYSISIIVIYPLIGLMTYFGVYFYCEYRVYSYLK